MLLLAGLPPLARAVPPPESVAILYNSAVPESRKLAELYREARAIPAENLIALEMPQNGGYFPRGLREIDPQAAAGGV